MNQIRYLKTVYFRSNYDLIWAQIMGMSGQEWTNMLPNSPVIKTVEPNSIYFKNGIFWEQIWPTFGPNGGQDWANMLPNYFHIKKIYWTFYQNPMNQILFQTSILDTDLSTATHFPLFARFLENQIFPRHAVFATW